eukprot:gene7934-7346_t
MEPIWMVLGHAAGVAAAMSAREGPSGAVADLDVAALRQRLNATGQVLVPRGAPSPPPPGPPPPGPSPPPPPGPAPLSGDSWYAWKHMWNISNSLIGTSSAPGVEPAWVAVAEQDKAVLKRSYDSSKDLPPSEVRFYNMGARVMLKAGPQQASHSDYWLVHAANVTDTVTVR